MKLYEVPRNTWIKVTDNGETLYFVRIKGAYSICTTDSRSIVHLPAGSNVTILEECVIEHKENL